jgi:hypothetical protein
MALWILSAVFQPRRVNYKDNIYSAARIFLGGLARTRVGGLLLRRSFLLTLLAAAIGCGGGASSDSGAPVAPPPPPSTGAVTTPTTVTVAGGATAAGNDIVVPAPASSAAENVTVLGTSVGNGGSASNTGSTISRGETKTVLMFGPGLSSSMQISITGPPDIVISDVRSIKSTSGTPGVAFTAAVGSDAALGARTVILRATNDDITTFTGGLEVLP